EAFERTAGAAELQDLTGSDDVEERRGLAIEADVARVRDVVDAIDLARELAELGAGKAEVHRGDVAFDEHGPVALLFRQRLELGLRARGELRQDGRVHERSRLAREDLFEHLSRVERRVAGDEENAVVARARHRRESTIKRSPSLEFLQFERAGFAARNGSRNG